MCTVLVSSLVSSTFHTHTERPILEWAPDRPDSDALEYFSKVVLPKEKDKVLSLVNAVSCAYMQSIIVAFSLCLKDNTQVTKGMGKKREKIHIYIMSKLELTSRTQTFPGV